VLAKFKDLCKENNIYTLCMLPYLLHLLQLLNVSCFLLLKLAYSSKIKGLMRCYITYIIKLEFLLAFKAAFYKAFIRQEKLGLPSARRKAARADFADSCELNFTNIVHR
jgi:hypothetical protein